MICKSNEKVNVMKNTQIKYWVQFSPDPSSIERFSINVAGLFDTTDKAEYDALEMGCDYNWVICKHVDYAQDVLHFRGLYDWRVDSVTLNNFDVQDTYESCDKNWRTKSERQSHKNFIKGTNLFLKRIEQERKDVLLLLGDVIVNERLDTLKNSGISLVDEMNKAKSTGHSRSLKRIKTLIKQSKVEVDAQNYEAFGVRIAGQYIPLKTLMDYLELLEFSQEKLLLLEMNYDQYERHRCKLHQALFSVANQDRIKDRDGVFCRLLDSIICRSLVCPEHGVSLLRENQCPTCGKVGFYNISELRKLVIFNLRKAFLLVEPEQMKLSCQK